MLLGESLDAGDCHEDAERAVVLSRVSNGIEVRAQYEISFSLPFVAAQEVAYSVTARFHARSAHPQFSFPVSPLHGLRGEAPGQDIRLLADGPEDVSLLHNLTGQLKSLLA
jgi:hypothetical protein